jgi:hypothetical protein
MPSAMTGCCRSEGEAAARFVSGFVSTGALAGDRFDAQREENKHGEET